MCALVYGVIAVRTRVMITIHTHIYIYTRLYYRYFERIVEDELYAGIDGGGEKRAV